MGATDIAAAGLFENAFGAALLVLDSSRISEQLTSTRLRLRKLSEDEDMKNWFRDIRFKVGCYALLVGFGMQMAPHFTRWFGQQ